VTEQMDSEHREPPTEQQQGLNQQERRIGQENESACEVRCDADREFV